MKFIMNDKEVEVKLIDDGHGEIDLVIRDEIINEQIIACLKKTGVLELIELHENSARELGISLEDNGKIEVK